jgi:tellurite resistance protein
LIERDSSPAPSSFSAPSAVKVKVERGYTGPKKSKKRSSCGVRKGEPRRCQNMIAQKKYRDKKVQASALVSQCHYQWNRADLEMSDTLVDIKAALKYASTKKRLEMIQSLVDQYDVNMRSELISVAALISRS